MKLFHGPEGRLGMDEQGMDAPEQWAWVSGTQPKVCWVRGTVAPGSGHSQARATIPVVTQPGVTQPAQIPLPVVPSCPLLSPRTIPAPQSCSLHPHPCHGLSPCSPLQQQLHFPFPPCLCCWTGHFSPVTSLFFPLTQAAAAAEHSFTMEFFTHKLITFHLSALSCAALLQPRY